MSNKTKEKKPIVIKKKQYNDVFLKNYIKSLQETDSVWNEMSNRTLHNILESGIQKHVTRGWYVEEIIPSKNKYLLNLKKRLQPLTDDEIANLYRDDNEPFRTMLDDYKRRLNTVSKELRKSDKSLLTTKRLSAKASCYRTIISELERALK
jgi:hypothetical protein